MIDNKLAHVTLDDFVKQLKEGLDTIVGQVEN